MIVIQGGLATGFGYVVLSERFGGIQLTLAVLVTFVAICTSIVIREIIERQHQWASWFVRK